jgi:hypothetical protein
MSEAEATPPRQLHAHQELNFSFDYFACEMGYFKVAGYSGVQPKLALDLNTEYWLIQKDDSNWMHPLGLAYQPDGAHDVKYPGSKGQGAPEVTDSANTADTPGYEYTYYIKKPGASNFEAKTLDDYEPLFFYPYDVWSTYEFKIKVKITNSNFAGSIVYFCHIHNKMSGLIRSMVGQVAKSRTCTIHAVFQPLIHNVVSKERLCIRPSLPTIVLPKFSFVERKTPSSQNA